MLVNQTILKTDSTDIIQDMKFQQNQERLGN